MTMKNQKCGLNKSKIPETIKRMTNKMSKIGKIQRKKTLKAMTPKNTNNIDKSAPSTIIPDKIPKNIFTPFSSNDYGWLLQAIL